MPNYCDFEMKVNGTKENLDKFYNYLKADYYYNSDGSLQSCTADKHLFRIFEVYLGTEGIYKEDENHTCIILGQCAWSVYSCMFEGDSTYYSHWDNKDKSDFRGTTLPKISEELQLDIEVFSEEGGCGFMEHFLIRKGVVEIEDCVDYHEEEDEETGEYKPIGGLEWNYTI